ncbi:MAG: DUF58 domain-containing protein [Myxococcota bacterium]|nr:DUF58 domain-containing protein [Myxococcota bacterium]
MLPLPTWPTVLASAGAAIWIALGIAALDAVLVAAGGCVLLGLVLAFAASVPLGRRVRTRRLELAWWLSGGSSGEGTVIVPGTPFEIRCYVRHVDARTLRLRELVPLTDGAHGALEEGATPTASDVLEVPPGTRVEFGLRLLAPAVGRVVVHGLASRLLGPLGLFEVPLYFPNPIVVRVLPRAARLGTTGPARVAVERAGLSGVRRRGEGTELHELREHRPGDPFRAIAWKASARRGRLVVRELEQEIQRTHVAVLDVSGTMRGGPPGRRKLDVAIDAVATDARRVLEQGDRFGLWCVDGRVTAHVVPREGPGQLPRVWDALLSVTAVVDADLTDVDDDALVEIVARYVRTQDGVEIARHGRPPRLDVEALLSHVRRVLGSGRADGIVAPTPQSALLRRYCQQRAIALSPRPEPGAGVKARGFADAMRAIVARSSEPVEVTLVTDFDAMDDLEPLLAAVRLARARAHRVRCVAIDGRGLLPLPRDEHERALAVVLGHGEVRRLSRARAQFGALGVPVVTLGSLARDSWMPPRSRTAQAVA